MALQTVVLAGATGVIGRRLVPLLLSDGRYRVVVLARNASRARQLFGAGVTVHEVDLLNPLHSLDHPLHDADAIVHIATKVPLDKSAPGAWAEHSRLRTEFTRRFLDAAIRQRVSYVVCQSIEMAYPDCGDELIDESVPLDTSPERSRTSGPVREMEHMMVSLPPAGPRWVILRGGLFIGKGTDEDQLRESLRLRTAMLPANPQAYQSMVSPAGFARAVALCLEQRPGNRIYNVNGPPLRFIDYLHDLAKAQSLPMPSSTDSAVRLHSFRCDASRIGRELGWSPTES